MNKRNYNNIVEFVTISAITTSDLATKQLPPFFGAKYGFLVPKSVRPPNPFIWILSLRLGFSLSISYLRCFVGRLDLSIDRASLIV